MSDARFEDGGATPIRLLVETTDDLAVISALLQDAVAQTSEMSWLPKKRRLSLLLNRFRWEDRAQAETQNRAFERVQSVLTIDDVANVAAFGVDPGDKSLVLSLLSLGFAGGDGGAGVLTLTFAGDGEIAVAVECLNVTLTDASRPYLARAKAAPVHSLD